MIVPDAKIDPKKNRFPYCIVWTPLPIISWIFPFIGHTGICDAEGVIYDFAGPYVVSRDDFAFGKVHKYFRLDIPAEQTAAYHKAIRQANKEYRKRNHSICCDNCHSHCAMALNKFKFKGRANYTMLSIWC